MKKTKSIKYLTCALSYIGISVTAYADSVAQKSLQSSVSDNWAVLGAPTLYATGMPTSSLICMDTTNSTIGTSPRVGFNFTSQATNEQISTSLNLGLSAESVGPSSFFDSANASFVATTKNTAYTLNFIYLYTYSTDAKLNPATYGNANLSPTGQSAFAAGQTAFFTSCGDSFVTNLNAGVVLAVNVGVNFKSKFDTYKFQESASFSGASLPTILQSIETELKNQKSTATISVSALQNGGTPESMQNIFINPETGNFNTMFCSSESVQNCQTIINGINRYALTLLPSQVQNGSGMIYNNLYFFNPILNSYSSLGITVPSPQPLPDAVQMAQNTILEQLNIYKNRIAFLNTYQQNSLPILPDVKSFIASQIKNLNNRISYINSKAGDCFNAYADTCPAIVTQITNTFKSSPTSYGFDKTKYGHLFDESWYYTKDNGKTLNYLVPVSFSGIFANYSTDRNGNLNKTSDTSQALYSEENGKKYVSQFAIRYGLTTFKCLPTAGDDKFSSTRNFRCEGGLFGISSFNAQFVKSVNPI